MNCKICKKRIEKDENSIQKFNHMVNFDIPEDVDDVTPIGWSHASCYNRLDKKAKKLKSEIDLLQGKLDKLKEKYSCF